MSTELIYDPVHHVAVCRRCQTCVSPTTTGIQRHLRDRPHRLSGQRLKAQVAFASTLSLRSLEELREKKPRGEDCPALEHLKVYRGYRCAVCSDFLTTHLPRMRAHMHLHKPTPPPSDKPTARWTECWLQTYFSARNRIDYFVVRVADGMPSGGGRQWPDGRAGVSSTEQEQELFVKLQNDLDSVKEDIEMQGGVVQNFDSRSARVPWLERTGFPHHLAGVKDAEIKSSYQLPKSSRGSGSQTCSTEPCETDPCTRSLERICNAAESLLGDAYELCSDTSPGRKMTQQRANILNEFYAGASGKADGFRYFKNPSTLRKYFTTFKQLLAFYFRVVVCENKHFTRSDPKQVLPGDCIQQTREQRQAQRNLLQALDDDDEAALKNAVRRLYLALICHTVGSTPYQSAVISFCAMLSRKTGKKSIGLWEEPGNFNSHLSALTWTAQLLIFDYVCFMRQDDERQIPVLLASICKQYFQQLAETPFGHILQWRLYLFKVGRSSIAKHQARWSLDGQTIEYQGLELKMSQVVQLVSMEYGQAHDLLYNELLFHASGQVPMQSWRLLDDLDSDEFGWSWLNLDKNAEITGGTERFLLRHIESTAELRGMFVVKAADGSLGLSVKAVEIYEATAQELLKRLLVLCHITAGQPLREPELLSVTWRNTARPRHILLWQKRVMIYTQYHKGQAQSGVYKDNVRFLPREVGDLLLDYIAYVLPLRQLFLRQQNPKALISPYLWSHRDGSVWPDGTLSRCLSKACNRAEVPRLHTANWRQISVSICKEKFSAKDRCTFDLDGVAAEVMEEEEDLVAMAEQSNHSYATFNRAYAGSSTLTMNTLLHRNHHASESWQAFFRFDRVLQGKRTRESECMTSSQMLNASKRSQLRRRVAYSKNDLTAVARKLLHSANIALRLPGQRDGLLAIHGAHAAEQVVIILGTGSGKSLMFMVGACVADAETTVLIVPLVALRRDMLRRCKEAGIKFLVWSASCKGRAPLVLVSAEAACTADFLEYVQRLIYRQQLDRIVIDECHLTITASGYRPSMSQLGWFVRQVRTQTVWLTATLPPAMEEQFIQHNKLVRPSIVRESTNRSNLRYNVSFEPRSGCLMKRAAKLLETFSREANMANQFRDKAIIYCRTRDEVTKLASLLKCQAYTSISGTDEEKAVIISDWLANRDQRAIVATSALGAGFDYPFIRWVIHVNEPDTMTDFAQQSGRAGRDGKVAFSTVLLWEGWKAEDSLQLSPDQEAMQLYLRQEFCSRGVMSQFLDAASDWRWCMVSDEPCQVCREPHQELRPVGSAFGLPGNAATNFTGPTEVLRQDYFKEQALDRYESDLKIMSGLCLHCRTENRRFDHKPGECSRRFCWIRAKETALNARKKEGRKWIAPYVACWKCYQPQDICRVADPDHEESVCRFPDMVMPACYGAYHRTGGRKWLQDRFGVSFRSEEDYMIWLGGTASLEGNGCIWANCVVAAIMEELCSEG